MCFDRRTMSNTIDKFGRRKQKSKVILRGQPGNGFKLSSDGHYDLQKKRLKNVGEPLDLTDATTCEYVDKCMKKLQMAIQQEIMELARKIQTLESVSRFNARKKTH